MKTGLVFSSLAHAAVLSWGLLTLTAPPPLEVADVEALPIDIVPIEELTQSIEGAKEVDFTETPAPVPTERPESVPEAENIGESETDLRSERDAEASETPVEAVQEEVLPDSEEPTPEPEVKPVPDPAIQENPAPTSELAAVNQEAVPVEEEPVSEEPAREQIGDQFAKLPDDVPLPAKRPAASKPQTAETTERKQNEVPAATRAATAKENEESTTDKIASLLNKQDPSSSGAKASPQDASLGTSRPSNTAQLSRSELDALRAAIERCWSVPAGIAEVDELRVTVKMRLSPNGEIDGRPDVAASGGESGARRAFAASAKRAVHRCAPYSLPKGKYDDWAEVVVNFSASEMF